jgi:arsenate reductase
MYANLAAYCRELIESFDQISDDRKVVLSKLTEMIRSKVERKEQVNLVYICTHNSRRSHFGQVWAALASHYYMIPDVASFSGGTEATAFNPNAINALQRAGMKVTKLNEDPNPHYRVLFGDDMPSALCFSKVYDHSDNPQKDFVAIMTCSDAEENCPFIPGANHRIATTYEDPKLFDATSLMESKYDERCRQIATEIFYVFSKV